MSRKISLGLALTITLLAMTATLSVTMMLSLQIFNSSIASGGNQELLYEKLEEIDTVVRNNLLHEINDQLLIDMTSTGYITGTGDSSTRYMTARQYTDHMGTIEGRIVSIGADVVKDAAGYLHVVRVYLDSPAAIAAMEVGSTIKTIDDIDVRTLSLSAAQSLLQGETGSETNIVWTPPNSIEDKTTRLLRASYFTPAVEYYVSEGNTGYIDLLRFNSSLSAELDVAVAALTGSGANGIIIDVRGISETSFDYVADAVDLFVGTAEIAQLQYKNREPVSLIANDSRSQNIPVVVLIDETTAGAAELFALSMRDLYGARLVGVTSAGLGTASELFRLSDGSAVSVTVALVQPSISEVYNQTGIRPDFEAVLTEEMKVVAYDLPLLADPQYLKGIEMLNTLRNEQGLEIAQEVTSTVPTEEEVIISGEQADSGDTQNSDDTTENTDATSTDNEQTGDESGSDTTENSDSETEQENSSDTTDSEAEDESDSTSQ